MASDNVRVLDVDNFDAEVLDSDMPVMVDFWASWCGPCKMIAPIIDQLADEFQGRVKVSKVNVDDNRELAAKYNVMSIPTLIFFKNGEIVNQVVGARPKAELETILNSIVD